MNIPRITSTPSRIYLGTPPGIHLRFIVFTTRVCEENNEAEAAVAKPVVKLIQVAGQVVHCSTIGDTRLSSRDEDPFLRLGPHDTCEYRVFQAVSLTCDPWWVLWGCPPIQCPADAHVDRQLEMRLERLAWKHLVYTAVASALCGYSREDPRDRTLLCQLGGTNRARTGQWNPQHCPPSCKSQTQHACRYVS